MQVTLHLPLLGEGPWDNPIPNLEDVEAFLDAAEGQYTYLDGLDVVDPSGTPERVYSFEDVEDVDQLLGIAGQAVGLGAFHGAYAVISGSGLDESSATRVEIQGLAPQPDSLDADGVPSLDDVPVTFVIAGEECLAKELPRLVEGLRRAGDALRRDPTLRWTLGSKTLTGEERPAPPVRSLSVTVTAGGNGADRADLRETGTELVLAISFDPAGARNRIKDGVGLVGNAYEEVVARLGVPSLNLSVKEDGPIMIGPDSRIEWHFEIHVPLSGSAGQAEAVWTEIEHFLDAYRDACSYRTVSDAVDADGVPVRVLAIEDIHSSQRAWEAADGVRAICGSLEAKGYVINPEFGGLRLDMDDLR